MSGRLGHCFHRNAEDHGNAFGSISELNSKLIQLPWEQVCDFRGNVLRKSCWLTEHGCSCKYQYGRRKRSFEANQYPDWLKKLSRDVEKELSLPDMYFNSANTNWYFTESHCLDPHADNEPLFREAEAPSAKRHVMIASVSFGQTRKFVTRRNYGDTFECLLNDGDLCTMEGLFQDNYTHAIAKAASSDSGNKSSASSSSSLSQTVSRFNITFRRVMPGKHEHSCCHN